MRRMELGVHRELSMPPSWLHLLFLLTGLYSLLCVLMSIPALEYPAAWVNLWAGILCVLLWRAGRAGWRWVFGAAFLCGILWAAAFAVLRETAAEQIARAVLTLSGRMDGAVPFTQAAWLLGSLLALLLFFLEFFFESHLFPYLLTTAALLCGPVLGIHPSVEAAALGLVFQMAFWAMHEAGMRQSRTDFALPDRGRLTAMTGTAAAVLVVLAMLLSLPLALGNADAVYTPVYEAEGFLRRMAMRASGAGMEPSAGGIVSRGNACYTGAEHLILTTDRQPVQPVYLRGFAGGDYSGGEWSRAGDEAIFRRMGDAWRDDMRERYGRTPPEEFNVSARIAGMWQSMYFALNSRTFREIMPSPVEMAVQQAAGEMRMSYVPYYGWRDSEYDGGGQLYWFYEQRDMAVDWDTLREFINTEDWEWVQAAYQNEIQTEYTRVPAASLPRLTALCRAAPLENREEITAFILHTLHSRASYSLTPGRTPLREEITEYFLFESGRGYCVHFASAATLMYRLYGIPARYAAGYVAWPEDFTALDDGTFRAVLPDSAAHAWTEIFLEDYGWTPVEVTPSVDGRTNAGYPGLDRTVLSGLLREWEQTAPVQPLADGLPEPHELPSLTADFIRSAAKHRPVFHGIGLAFPLIALPAAYLLRRRRLRQWEHAPCRAVYGRLLGLLRFSGAPEGPDFPDRLSWAAPSVPRADAERLCRMVEAAAYGPDNARPEADAFARTVWIRAAESVRQSLRWWKRPLFRFLYG